MGKLPLEGIRVADFTWVWAGPYCAMFMALMGAEVIKVENRDHLDLARYIYPFAYADPRVHKEYLESLAVPLAERGPFPHGEPGPDQCGYFNRLNHGKMGVTIDLKRPEGVHLARDLVSVSDVVVENYSPRVMTSLGLDYKSLVEIKPDIVYLALSGFGATGPDRNHAMYGEGQTALSGMSSLTGYPGGRPLLLPVPYADPIGAMHGLIAVLAALKYRRDTGQGQYIDISQWESALSFIPEGLMGYMMNRRIPPRAGNRDEVMAPHGCYPCLGEDRWIAIAVGAEEEWRALCRCIGRPELTEDPRFENRGARHWNQAALDEILSEWTREQTPYGAMELLQGEGVAATPVLNNEELVKEPHLNERGFFVEADHPATGPRVHPGVPFKFSETPFTAPRAPMLGEHNRRVFCDLLGYTPSKVTRLEAQGVVR